MFNSIRKTTILDSANSNSLFGKGTSIKGDISGDGDVRIDGNLQGNVFISGKLIVGETAVLRGEIRAERAEIYGRTIGRIHVNGLLSIKSTAVVEGDLHVGELQIEKSAIFNGVSHMVLPGQIVGLKNDQMGNHENPKSIAFAQ